MELTAGNLKKVLSKSSSLGEKVEEFDNENGLTEQGVDSLDMLDFYLNIEETFGIQIPDDDIDKMKSINDILDYLKEKIGEH
ncbi:acyl carrier protein [Flagellimonas sp.]|uniref:acyl carrier protein n=1 Tax=Flagellimonas TaxID=444459 RepID=UPI003B53052E